MARPTKYKKEFAKQVYKLALLSATDQDIADFFEVEEKTINNWKKAHKEFLQSLKKGKVEADQKVAETLLKKALGFTKQEEFVDHFKGSPVKIKYKKYYAPDTTAIIFWLKNRQRDKWTDSKDHKLTGKLSITDLVKNDE